MRREKELQRECLGRQRRAFPVLVATLVLHEAELAVRAELAVQSLWAEGPEFGVGKRGKSENLLLVKVSLC